MQKKRQTTLFFATRSALECCNRSKQREAGCEIPKHGVPVLCPGERAAYGAHSRLRSRTRARAKHAPATIKAPSLLSPTWDLALQAACARGAFWATTQPINFPSQDTSFWAALQLFSSERVCMGRAATGQPHISALPLLSNIPSLLCLAEAQFSSLCSRVKQPSARVLRKARPTPTLLQLHSSIPPFLPLPSRLLLIATLCKPCTVRLQHRGYLSGCLCNAKYCSFAFPERVRGVSVGCCVKWRGQRGGEWLGDIDGS